MSYLGQAKWIPGQISFSTLPPGQTSLPSLQPLVEAGLPIAPYIEHGSWVTGEPAIMRYGRDPYRGLGNKHTMRSEIHMGLGQTAAARHMDATYVVLCDNWARFNGIGQGHRLRGLRAAILSAKNAARRAPGDTCRIYPLSAGPLFMIKRGLIAVRAKRGGDYDVKVIQSPSGLSGAFEDLQQVEKNWGRNMLARLSKATFHLSNSFYVNVAPEAAKGLKPALSRAKAILADNQGDGRVDVIYVTRRGERPLFPSDTIIVRVERQGGTLRLTWMPQIAPQAPMGLAGPLTEFVCSDTQAGQMLSAAVNEAIDQGAMAAAIGAVIAGAIGGMLEKPGIGALAGAAVGYVAHYAWTAPYRR
jgi:hypothetical protein